MTNEEIKRAGEVMIAAAMKKPIQLQHKGDFEWSDAATGECLEWNWNEFNYRVRPTKKVRPWNPSEVPVDAWFRTGLDAGLWFKVCQFNAVNGTITNYDDDGWTPGEALAGLSHSIDGGKTWLRCGVEVEE